MNDTKTEIPAKNIKVKIWHKTTDTDLAKGQKVITKGVSGEFTQVGTIDRIDEKWFTKYYIVNHTAYTASEIKLIDETQKIEF